MRKDILLRFDRPESDAEQGHSASKNKERSLVLLFTLCLLFFFNIILTSCLFFSLFIFSLTLSEPSLHGIFNLSLVTAHNLFAFF